MTDNFGIHLTPAASVPRESNGALGIQRPADAQLAPSTIRM